MHTGFRQVLECRHGAFRRQQVDVDDLGLDHPSADTTGRVDLLDGEVDAVQPVGLIGDADRPRLGGGNAKQDRIGRPCLERIGCGNRGRRPGLQETSSVERNHVWSSRSVRRFSSRCGSLADRTSDTMVQMHYALRSDRQRICLFKIGTVFRTWRPRMGASCSKTAHICSELRWHADCTAVVRQWRLVQ